MDLSIGSCFSGIGGFDLGLEAAGVGTTAWYSEIDTHAITVMKNQFSWAKSIGDITTCTSLATPVDLLCGGPPCQNISEANAYGREGLAGIKSQVFHAYAALVEHVKPEWVLMEQVAGLLTSGVTKGADFALVIKVWKDLGYELAVARVNSRTYVPQARDRLYIVGSREPGAAGRAVLPLLADGAGPVAEGGQAPKRWRPSGPTSSPGCYRKSRRPASNTDAESWVEADYCNTLTTFDVGLTRATLIVVDKNGRPRIMTPEEWEGCHGFPAGWTAAAPHQVRYKLLGNALSPPIAERLGQGIIESYEDAS